MQPIRDALVDNFKKNRVVKSKQLLKQYAKGGQRKKLFTDENIFTIDHHFNRQNGRIYTQSSKEASQLVDRVQRGHSPTSMMVWWDVSYEGVIELLLQLPLVPDQRYLV